MSAVCLNKRCNTRIVSSITCSRLSHTPPSARTTVASSRYTRLRVDRRFFVPRRIVAQCLEIDPERSDEDEDAVVA